MGCLKGCYVSANGAQGSYQLLWKRTVVAPEDYGAAYVIGNDHIEHINVGLNRRKPPVRAAALRADTRSGRLRQISAEARQGKVRVLPLSADCHGSVKTFISKPRSPADDIFGSAIAYSAHR